MLRFVIFIGELEPPFEQTTVDNIEDCQFFCADIYEGVCQFWTYDYASVDRRNCKLYAIPPTDYAASCTIIGGSKNDNPVKCANPSNPCAVRKTSSFQSHTPPAPTTLSQTTGWSR